MKNANPVSWWPQCLVLLIFSALLSGCGQDQTSAKTKPKTVDAFFEIKVGNQPVRMQLAILQTEMEHGLMGRRDLGENEGMLFVYLRPQRLSFWMHNTPLPLDIGFFDATGTLREIYQMYPFDETPVPSHSDQLQFALEMNQGWFKQNGVRPGDQLDRQALVEALKARDFKPEQFKLP